MTFYGTVSGAEPVALEVGGVVTAPTVRALILTGRGELEAGSTRPRVRFDPVPYPRRVYRINVQGDATSRAYVYVGEPIAENVVTGTDAGQFDENDSPNGYFLPESTPLVIEWTAGTPAACVARVEAIQVV